MVKPHCLTYTKRYVRIKCRIQSTQNPTHSKPFTLHPLTNLFVTLHPLTNLFFTLHPLTNLFFPTPTRLLWETFRGVCSVLCSICSLSVVCTNLSPEREMQLKNTVARKLGKGSLFYSKGSINTIEFRWVTPDLGSVTSPLELHMSPWS